MSKLVDSETVQHKVKHEAAEHKCEWPECDETASHYIQWHSSGPWGHTKYVCPAHNKELGF